MTGGAGGAAGNGGVPVLQGLGGGSATEVPFPSFVGVGERVAESSRSEPQEFAAVSGVFPGAWSSFFRILVKDRN